MSYTYHLPDAYTIYDDDTTYHTATVYNHNEKELAYDCVMTNDLIKFKKNKIVLIHNNP